MRWFLPAGGTLGLALAAVSAGGLAWAEFEAPGANAGEAASITSSDAALTAPVTDASSRRARRPDRFYQAIAERPLFAPGRRPAAVDAAPAEPEVVEAVEPEPAAPEALAARLSGVMAGGARPAALIAIGAAAPEWVRVGDSVGSWILVGVDGAGADLESGGRSQRLELHR